MRSPLRVRLVALGRRIPLPLVVRRTARDLLIRALRRQGTWLPDWDQPLVAGRPLRLPPGPGPGPARPHGAVPGAGPRPQADPVPRGPGGDDGLRCMIMTVALDAGGMDEVAGLLARRLPERGITVAVTALSDSAAADGRPTGRLGRMLAAEGIRTVEIPATACDRVLREWRPDVLSLHGTPDVVLDRAGDLGIPCVETLHGMHNLFSGDWSAEAARSGKVAALVAVSSLVRRQYLQGNPEYPADRIVVIPNGVDDRYRRRVDRQQARSALGLEDERLIVSLGRHCLQKNTYGLVSAFADVARAEPSVHLLAAGRPDDELYLRQVLALRDSLPSRDRIHLRDHFPAPELLLAAADGFVLDSYFEGWSMASMEAMQAGLRVVLAEVGGAVEQVGGDARRGFVVANPLADPVAVNWQSILDSRYSVQLNREELAQRVRQLLHEHEDWLGDRSWIAEDAVRRFDLDSCVAAHARVLADAASGAVPAEPGGAQGRG